MANQKCPLCGDTNVRTMGHPKDIVNSWLWNFRECKKCGKLWKAN